MERQSIGVKETGMRTIGTLYLAGVVVAVAGCMVPQAKETKSPQSAGDAATVAAASSQPAAPRGADANREDEFDRLLKDLDATKSAPRPGPAPSTQPAPRGPVDKLLGEMQAEEGLRAQEAADLIRRGDEKRAESDFKTAADCYRQALAADPANREARDKLDQVEFLMGERRATVERLAGVEEREMAIRVQQELDLVDRLIREGVDAMAQGRLDEAQFRLQQAQARLVLLRPAPEVQARRDRIDARLRDVSERLAQRQEEQRVKREREIQAEIDERDRIQAQLREEEVKTLVERAREAFALKDYDQCVQICNAILETHPLQIQARALIRKAQEMQGKDWRDFYKRTDNYNKKSMWLALAETAQPEPSPFTFPEEDMWSIVSQRAEDVTLGAETESEEIREIKRRLATVKINLDFEDRALIDVVDFIKRIARINIFIDPDVDAEETKVSVQLNEIQLKDALDLIMTHTKLAYTFQKNLLVITVPEKAMGSTVFKIYNVSDILFRIRDFPGPTLDIRTPDEEEEGGGPGGGAFTFGDEDEQTELAPEDLEQLIRDSTGGDEVWEEPMSMRVHRKQLLVEATPELHAQVKKVLGELRKDSDLFVVVRARFVDLFDDFLEDIGVDYRNLGQRNTPWPRTYNGRIPDSRTGGQDPGFVLDDLGVEEPEVLGRLQNILDGFASTIRGERVFAGSGGLGGLSLQYMMVDPYQLTAIVRAVQEESQVRSVIAPEVTAHNGQRVYVSVITQRSYIADYELVSGGTTYTLTEVADPIVRVNEEGVVLDVRPTVSADRKYITIDVQPTLATLIGGVISTILINLGTVMAAAMQVPIGLPKMSIQRTWTSVTVPDGGTVLLGGFRSMDEKKYVSTVPIVGQIPILNLLFRRRAELREKRSLIILISAKMMNLRKEEADQFGMNTAAQ